jgi:hypothetical protein
MKILYWSEKLRPLDCVRDDIPREKREAVAKILADGKAIEHWRGIARCRLCSKMLGSADLSRYGFIWPQRAEHYVIKHNVWVPELDVLLEKASADA